MTSLAEFTKKEFLPLLTDRILSLGFNKAREQIFTMPHGDGLIGVSYQFSYYQPDVINIAVECAVSLTFVQARLIEIGYYQFRKKPVLTWTFGRNIGHIKGKDYAVWAFSNSYSHGECADIADLIASDVANFGVDYLKRNSTEPAVFDLAYNPEGRKVFDFATLEAQSLVAIILAERLNKHDLIPSIVSYTLRYYQIIEDDFYYNRFRDLVEKLKAIRLH